MNRNTFLRIAAAAMGGWVTTSLPPSFAQSPPNASPDPSTNALRLEWLHHSCVLFQEAKSGQRILVNPFRSLGCTAGYPPPAVAADIVLLSSRLFDEGAVEVVTGQPQVLFQPGDYQINGIRVQGVRMAHDNTTPRGERFGINVGWRWSMGGLSLVHLGGAAAPITREQEILLAAPDILLIPVGGGPKNYDAAGAQAAIEVLKPKLVIPTMYRTEAAGSECDLKGLEEFVQRFPTTTVQAVPTRQITLSAQSLPASGMQIIVFPEA